MKRPINELLSALILVLLAIFVLWLAKLNTQAQRLTIGAEVRNKLVVTESKEQKTFNPQTTEGIDVLQYCAKDGLEWQVSCDVLVR